MPLGFLFRALAISALLLLLTPGWSAGEEEPPLPPTPPTSPSSSETASQPAAAGVAMAQVLVDAGRYAEALVILGPLIRAEEIDPDTLFLFGLAAMGTSHQPGLEEEDREALLDGAIAAFREMLIDRPGLVRVHLELGRAFFLKEEDDLARRHFEWVLAGNPPQPVVANVNRFLAAIQARRRWSFNVGAALAPDSNIGAGSEERTIYVPVFGQPLPFERDAEELTSSGIGVSVWGGAEYQVPIGERLRLRAGGDAARREYSGSKFDQLFLATHLGPRWLMDQNTEGSLMASARQRWIGTVPDNRELGARLEVGRRLTPRVTVFANASWHDRRYRMREHLTGRSWMRALRGSWVVTPTVRATSRRATRKSGPSASASATTAAGWARGLRWRCRWASPWAAAARCAGPTSTTSGFRIRRRARTGRTAPGAFGSRSTTGPSR